MGFDLLASAVAGLLGFALGGFLRSRKTKRDRAASRQAPSIWPLRPRSILNSQELQVWRWLTATFSDHFVAVKMPVTRFTLPLPGENSKDLYRLLGGIYCTFAICRADGYVVACVDLPGPRGIKQSNREVKASLLGQCGIRYEILIPSALPQHQEARELLLGPSTARRLDASGSEVSDAHRRLRRSITERRSGRASAPPPEESGYAPTDWQQADSFVAPLDSRVAELY